VHVVAVGGQRAVERERDEGGEGEGAARCGGASWAAGQPSNSMPTMSAALMMHPQASLG